MASSPPTPAAVTASYVNGPAGGANDFGLPPLPGSTSTASPFNLGPLGQKVLVGSGTLLGLPQDVPFDDAMTAFSQANDPNTVAQIQSDLLSGGFYPARFQPQLGVVRPQDISALISALKVPARAGGDVGDYLSTTASAVQAGGLGGTGGTLYQTDVHAIDLTDPNAIGDEMDTAFQKALGRKPTESERATFTANFHSDQTNYYQSLYNAQDAAKRNFIQSANTRQQSAFQTAQQKQSNVTAPSVPRADGSSEDIGPDQAQAYGQDFALKYGLTVTSGQRSAEENARVGGAPNSDHLTGMAVDIASDPNDPRSQDKMNALAQWAHANEGPGKVFRWVGWQVPGHYDHVHLSFNPSVTDPTSLQSLDTAPNSTPAQSSPSYDTQRDSFMAGLRMEENSGQYGWDANGIGARGAYQFMPSTWQSAAKGAGIDPNDHSPQAQDAAARYMIDQYYQRYNGDWSLVAAAWLGGPGSADAVKKDPNKAHLINDGATTIAQYQQKVLGYMNQYGGGYAIANDQAGVPLSETVTGTKPDLGSDALAYARQTNPIESAAHDAASYYDTFTKMLGPVVTPEKSVL